MGPWCYLRTSALMVVLLCGAPSVASAPALQAEGSRLAPSLVLKDLEGRTHELSAYRGRVVLINFWATWCEPCRQEMPALQRLQEKLSGKPFAVLAVNVDEPESRVRHFLRETRLDLLVLLDQNKTATRAWDVRLLSVTYVVGTDGRVRYRVIGDTDWTHAALLKVISELLAGG